MPDSRWLVFLDPVGKVVGVAGGAPKSWVDRSRVDLDALVPALAPCSREVVESLERGDDSARATTRFDPGGGLVDVEVIGLRAIPIKRGRHDLVALIERALEPFRGQAAARDVALALDVAGESLAVDVDAAKICWVIATLVGNALRFVRSGTRHHPGGTIHVRARRVERERRVAIEVEDDGPGIEPARIARLFERRDGAEPAGVALHMARDVALAHGGNLEVESSTDAELHGTRVRLTLPSASAKARRDGA